MQELVLVRGLPGSGKSTLANWIGCQHYETDMFFCSGGEYVFDRERLKEAHAWCKRSARKELEAGRSVVVANTFTRLWEMQAYLDMARELGVPVRILKCTGSWENVHGVPKEVVDRMRANWEDMPGECVLGN